MNNYELNEYEFEDKYKDDFISLMNKLYCNYKHKDSYINAIKKIIDKRNPSFKLITIKNFIAYKDEEVVGHISAIIDKRLNNNHFQIGILGFYECVNDKKLASLIINRALNYLKEKNCSLVRGPININIWNSYRFAIDQKENDTFILEPLSKHYYIDQFYNEGFRVICEYSSAERTNFNSILPFTKTDYESIINQGFNIRNLNKNNFKDGILSIYEISRKTFKDSLSFVDISKDEFIYIYEDYKKILDQLLIQIISNKWGVDIGFCSSIIDPLDKETIILKTIGVIPEYQNKKVGAALLYMQHKIAQEMNINREIYALIKTGNIITKLPYPGIKVIRKYVMMEKNII